MIELRFHQDFYTAAAVESARQVFAEHADVAIEPGDGGLVVRITSRGMHAEREIGDELANYVLGLTIEAQRTAEPTP